LAGGRAQFLKFGPLVTVDGEADTLDHGGIRGARHGVRVVLATLFSEASAMGASAIRLDVPPAIVFGGPSSDPGASERCGTDDLAWCSS
jgi:hypothetical protein